MVELADVFRHFADGYLAAHGAAMPTSHRRAIEAIVACRTPELPVPGMRHFMRHKAGGVSAQIIFYKSALRGAVIAGFMMLQAKVGGVIAQREQEVIVTVVGSAEQRAGFRSQVLEVGQFVSGNFQGGRDIGNSIKVNFGIGITQCDFDEIFSGQHRGIDQCSKRNRGELYGVAASACGLERGAIFPPRRQLQAGSEGNGIAPEALGIEQDLVPTDDGQLFGRRCTRRKQV